MEDDRYKERMIETYTHGREFVSLCASPRIRSGFRLENAASGCLGRGKGGGRVGKAFGCVDVRPRVGRKKREQLP